jgi:hypothetical protein
MDKPFGSSLVVSVPCEVIIDGRIWRGKPSSEALLQLVAYDLVLVSRNEQAEN